MSKQDNDSVIQDQLASLFASLPRGVIVTDLAGNITLSNQRAEQLLGYKPQEVLRQPVTKFFQSPETAQRLTEPFDGSADGQPVNWEALTVSKAGASVLLHLSLGWLFKGGQKPIGRVLYFDHRQPAEQAERSLNQLLTASNSIAQAENLDDGLQDLAENIVKLLSSTFCRILLIDEAEQYLIVKAACYRRRHDGDFEWRELKDEWTPIDEWPGLRERLEVGGARVLNQNDEDEQAAANLERLTLRLGLPEPIRSLISVPVKANDKKVGLLLIGNVVSDSEAVFDEQKVDLAAGIAAQVAVLIKRLQLAEVAERHRHLLKALDEALRHIRAEKERPKLLKEVPRLAANLVRRQVGCLYVNHPYRGELELGAVYGLPGHLVGKSLAHKETLLGAVARQGKRLEVSRDMAAGEPLFELFELQTAFCVPLIQAGKVEAILIIGDPTSRRPLPGFDKEVLERFALHTAHALHTSQLINQEQRLFSNFTTLLNVIEHIQGETDWHKVLHIMLIGVTAGPGLGFNRASLFLLEEGREHLVGWAGIGQMSEPEVQAAWQRDSDAGLYDLSGYLEEFKREGLRQTALGERVVNLRLAVAAEAGDAFAEAVVNCSSVLVGEEKLHKQLPAAFVEAMEPTTEVVVIPLMTRREVIGLLVADNKFTQAPITDTDIDLLMTFVGTAAIASDLEGQRLRSYFEASNSLALSRDQKRVVDDLVEQMLGAAKARWVCLVPSEERRRKQPAPAAGQYEAGEIEQLLRREESEEEVAERDEPRRTLKLEMKVGGKQVGTVWFHYDAPRQFPSFEREALQFYVNQAAVAYDSEQRLKKVDTMRQAAEELAAATDLKTVLEVILSNAKRVLDVDSAVIWSYDADRDSFSLEVSEATGITAETLAAINKIQPRKGGTAYTVLEDGYVGVEDVKDEGRYPFIGESVLKLLETFGARSFQGVVLKGRDVEGKPKHIGVLYLNYNHLRRFDEEDQEIAQIFADHVALALTNAKLFEQFTQAKEAAALVAKFMVAGDSKLTLESIVEGTQKVLRSDAVVLFTYDEGSKRLHHPPTMTGVNHPEGAAAAEEKLVNSIVYQMVHRDEPYVVNDVAADPLFRGKQFAEREEIKSCVAIPLQAGHHRVGVMFVNYRTLHPITSNDLANLDLFANYAAVAIHYAELFEEQKAWLKEQQSLVDLTQTVLASLSIGDLQGIMDSVVAAAAKVLGTEFCNIVLRNDDDEELVFRAAHGWPRWMVGTFKLLPDGGSQTGYTIQHESPVRVDDYLSEDHFEVPDIVGQYKIRSGISVPMFRGNKVVGAMLAHTTQLRRFTDADERLLSLVANLLATVISSARYEEIQQHYENLRSVYEASKEITKLDVKRERKQILDHILQQAVKCIKRRRNREVVLGTIQLYDERTKRLVFESISPANSGGEYLIGMGWEVGGENDGKNIGVTGRAFLTKEPQLVRDVEELREGGKYREYNRQTRSELAMPMIDSEGRCVGVLDVESGEVGSFDEYDQEMMRLLAELAVIGIQSLQTMTKLMVSSVLTWTGMSGSFWRHKIQEDAILIKDQVGAIREALGTAPSKKIATELNSIERHAKSIIDDYDTSKLSPDKAAPQAVNALLRDRVNKSKAYAPKVYKTVEVRFSLKLPEDAKVKVHPTWFSRPLNILMDNATRAMQDSPAKVLTIATREEGDWAVIEISDTGKGIPEAVQSKLFVEPIKDGGAAGGLGVGLLMAREIVEAYGGRVRLGVSNLTGDSMGTTMVIHLPLCES